MTELIAEYVHHKSVGRILCGCTEAECYVIRNSSVSVTDNRIQPEAVHSLKLCVWVM